MNKDLQEIEDKGSKDKNYRTFLYWKEGDEIKSGIFSMEEAQDQFDKLGAKLSPGEFHPELGQDPSFLSVSNDVAGKMNQLINIDEIKDKSRLVELGEFYGLKLKRGSTLKNLRFKIKEAAGTLEGVDHE